jgi:hypothetical protein
MRRPGRQQPPPGPGGFGRPGGTGGTGGPGGRGGTSGSSGSGGFAGTADALAAVEAGLAFLARADAAALTVAEQAACLRGLTRAESAHTAAHARILTAFTAQAGYEDDGHAGPRAWLVWQARITRGAATGALGWARRLAGHPLVAGALAAGEISESWARKLCEWTDRLPGQHRGDADRILLGAADGGADLADLYALAEEIRSRCAGPDTDGDDGFTRRALTLSAHFEGGGHLDGNLTPECAAALQAVLDSLGKKAGPEDDRTSAQRRHDALEEACRRLIASNCLPDVAGQAVQIQLHMTLDQLRNLPGGSAAERQWAAQRAWQAGRAAGDGRPGWITDRVAAEAYACDAQIAPMVTGYVDPAALEAMVGAWLAAFADPANGGSSAPAGPDPAAGAARTSAPGAAPGGSRGSAARDPAAGGSRNSTRPASAERDSCGPAADPAARDPLTPAALAAATRELTTAQPLSGEPFALPRWARQHLAGILLRYAADALSGPGGLASFLRTSLLPGTLPQIRLPDPAASVSLPLDVGTATRTIPPWLRRAVIERDRHCAFPGCTQPPAACHVHHLIPRSEGGATALTNMVLLCSFHHLIAVHRWGWTLALSGDGTTTATSKDGKRVLHSHGPPAVPAT